MIDKYLESPDGINPGFCTDEGEPITIPHQSRRSFLWNSGLHAWRKYMRKAEVKACGSRSAISKPGETPVLVPQEAIRSL